MSLTEILVVVYLAVGACLFLFVVARDEERTGFSLTGFLGMLSSVWGLTELLFIALWPIWMGLRWLTSKAEEPDAPGRGSDHEKRF